MKPSMAAGDSFPVPSVAIRNLADVRVLETIPLEQRIGVAVHPAQRRTQVVRHVVRERLELGHHLRRAKR